MVSYDIIERNLGLTLGRTAIADPRPLWRVLAAIERLIPHSLWALPLFLEDTEGLGLIEKKIQWPEHGTFNPLGAFLMLIKSFLMQKSRKKRDPKPSEHF